MHKVAISVSISFLLFIIWVIYLANTGQHSIFFDLVGLIPYGDKVGHVFIFGFLTIVTNFASQFRAFSVYKINVFWGTAAVTTFATIEELSQYFIATRTLDIYDYSADMLGIFVFTIISIFFSKKITKART